MMARLCLGSADSVSVAAFAIVLVVLSCVRVALLMVTRLLLVAVAIELLLVFGTQRCCAGWRHLLRLSHGARSACHGPE